MAKKKTPVVQQQNGGRPREHDREKIANELIEWAKKDDSINLCGFCCSREPPLDPSKISLWALECERFRQAYRTAKAFIGNRRELMLSQERLHVKAYDLNATTYDPFLKEERMAMSSYEASLRKEVDSKPTQINIRVDHDGLGSGLGVSTKKLSTTVHKSSK